MVTTTYKKPEIFLDNVLIIERWNNKVIGFVKKLLDNTFTLSFKPDIEEEIVKKAWAEIGKNPIHKDFGILVH